jgi:hypothetical protein
MNAVSLSPDATKLRAIRSALLAISPADWTRAADENGGLIEARGAYGELLVLARFDAASADEQAFAADAPGMVSFLLRLLDAPSLRSAPATATVSRRRAAKRTMPPNAR